MKESLKKDDRICLHLVNGDKAEAYLVAIHPGGLEYSLTSEPPAFTGQGHTVEWGAIRILEIL